MGKTLPKSIELDDLVSAGLFGLMDAIRGFDASRGIKFKTYCTTRIRGSILDELRSQDWVPRLVRLKAGKIDFRVEKAGIVHAPIGKASFDAEKLIENFNVLMNELHRAKPSAAKGTYMKSITISSTMGPGIKIDPAVVKEKKD